MDFESRSHYWSGDLCPEEEQEAENLWGTDRAFSRNDLQGNKHGGLESVHFAPPCLRQDDKVWYLQAWVAISDKNASTLF